MPKKPISAPRCFGIGGDFDEGLGDRSEQQVVEFDFVLPDESGQFMRQTEHHMEVAGRQEFPLSGGDPTLARLSLTLGTMAIPARVKGDGPVAAATRAHVDMTAESRRAAIARWRASPSAAGNGFGCDDDR